MKLTKEPVAYLTFVIIAVTVIRDIVAGNVDIGTAVDSLVFAFGGLLARQAVTPNSKLTDGDHQTKK